MKKMLLTLMLAVMSSSAMAEWVEFIKDDEEILTVYVDPTTIHVFSVNFPSLLSVILMTCLVMLFPLDLLSDI